MMEPTAPLQEWLRCVRESTGARSVVLYAPPAWEGATPVFAHDGEVLLPELENVERAGEFERALATLIVDTDLLSSPAQLAASKAECRLIRVPLDWGFRSRAAAAQKERRRSDRSELQELASCVLIGFCFGENARAYPASRPTEPVELAFGDEADSSSQWSWLLSLVATMTRQAQAVASVLHDPVSKLPGRSELLTVLDRVLSSSRETGSPASLLLINPDEFDAINQRFGREAGDEVIRDLAKRVRGSFRSTDHVAKYGGVSFACTLPDTPPEAARSVAAKACGELAEASFLSGSVRLGFSVGVTTFEPGSDSGDTGLDLMRRADQALFAAKRAGGGRVESWQQEWEAQEIGHLDRLSGIFTGNLTKDYRNMVLLLDTISILAGTEELQELASEVVTRLQGAFKPRVVGVFTSSGQGFSLLSGEPPEAADGAQPGSSGEIPASQAELLARARDERRAILQSLGKQPGRDGDRGVVCVVPLLTSEACLGCLYLEVDGEASTIDSSDLLLLKALVTPMAVAMDRAQLTAQEKRRLEEERQRLTTELTELRGALQAAKLVYRSSEMEAVLSVARRVAPTDATVLITGESGTGKELLARAIHELSPRRSRSLTVVDCTAVPTTLVESELFGHERGAYTGADQRKLGRLAEADGGTVLLDEIGELPLEVQSKLLRFVQEKRFTPVGGSGERAVDVRVIAATNRDLAAEVRAGRFREDLYYRLNVIRLIVPPLRERPHDILHLSDHFREVFSLLYRKGIVGMTPEAEAVLLQYEWPGNVRELQNRIMQAVILCEAREIGVPELGPADAAFPVADSASVGLARAESTGSPAEPHPKRHDASAGLDPWTALRQALARQIAEITAAGPKRAVPLGEWLREDLMLEANAASEGVSRRAAAAVGIPETTFRRRLGQAENRKAAGLAERPESWRSVRTILAGIVGAAEGEEGDLPARAERILMEELDSGGPRDIRFRSTVLGVSVPTYRRRSVRRITH